MQSSSEPVLAAASPEPRIVAGQLAELWRRLFLDPRADHFGAIEDHELSLTQVRILSLLAVADAPAPAGALAERLGISPAAISRSLDALVRRELASRRECSDDRRVRLVAISNAGTAIVEELLALRTAGLERFVADLSPGQREQLSAALLAIDPEQGAAR